jgi:hypothetical protein
MLIPARLMTRILARVLVVTFVHRAAFSWRSFMSPIVAMSTSEAELIGACACAQEIQFSQKLAAELGFRSPILSVMEFSNCTKFLLLALRLCLGLCFVPCFTSFSAWLKLAYVYAVQCWP